MNDTARRLLAECFGTYALVFAGTGAIIINDVAGGAITHVGVALTFGLIVLAMIYSLGHVSGCHINPAVTVGLFLGGKFSGAMVLPYIVSQVVGALLASFGLRLLFPDHMTLGATIPSGSYIQSWVLEFQLTLILMFVIFHVTSAQRDSNLFAGVAIGAVVALEAMFAGPICGASMNPARSIGPAVVSMNVAPLWIYMTAPLAGAATSVILFRATARREPNDCQKP
ncbi:MAG: aquaporin [Pirellula sp.]|jgi:aquaporin Z|nr:aquaporin [Pirellula sp.]